MVLQGTHSRMRIVDLLWAFQYRKSGMEAEEFLWRKTLWNIVLAQSIGPAAQQIVSSDAIATIII